MDNLYFLVFLWLLACAWEPGGEFVSSVYPCASQGEFWYNVNGLCVSGRHQNRRKEEVDRFRRSRVGDTS